MYRKKIILKREMYARREAKSPGETGTRAAGARAAVVTAWDPCSAFLWPQDRRIRDFPAAFGHAALDPCQRREESGRTRLAPRGGAQPPGCIARRARNQRSGCARAQPTGSSKPAAAIDKKRKPASGKGRANCYGT